MEVFDQDNLIGVLFNKFLKGCRPINDDPFVEFLKNESTSCHETQQGGWISRSYLISLGNKKSELVLMTNTNNLIEYIFTCFLDLSFVNVVDDFFVKLNLTSSCFYSNPTLKWPKQYSLIQSSTKPLSLYSVMDVVIVDKQNHYAVQVHIKYVSDYYDRLMYDY